MAVKTFVGGNCTVSFDAVALGGLFEKGPTFEWMNLYDFTKLLWWRCTPYARNWSIKWVCCKVCWLRQSLQILLSAILEIDVKSQKKCAPVITHDSILVVCHLAGSFDPFTFDSQLDKRAKAAKSESTSWGGNQNLRQSTQTNSSWTVFVFVSCQALSSQAIPIKLNKDIPVADIEGHGLLQHNEWVSVMSLNE